MVNRPAFCSHRPVAGPIGDHKDTSDGAQRRGYSSTTLARGRCTDCEAVLPRLVSPVQLPLCRHGIDTTGTRRLYDAMKVALLAATVCLLSAIPSRARQTEAPHLLTRVTALPTALDSNFQFRKTKLYFLSEHNTLVSNKGKGGGKNGGKGGAAGSDATRAKSGSAAQDASINFERQYRLYGAVTKLDEHERFGDYLDFYWRAKQPADVTVRLEYQQEKLHAHVQAQEIAYQNVRGTQKSEFKVVGDDYFDNGRITAWRCLLVVNGQIVAENRSFLWR